MGHGHGADDARTHFRQSHVDWQQLAARQAEAIPLAERWWALVGSPVGKRLADIGCGPGVLAARYAALGAHVLAVDLRPDALEHVPRHARLRTLAHDLEGAPLPEHVDVLMLTDVLHHAAKPDAILRNARASTDRILVADHDVGPQHGPPVGSRLSPERVCQLLRDAGFEPRPVLRPVPGQYAIVADAA